MINTDQLTAAFNNAGLDTPEKLDAFLKPSAIAAQLADYDGKIAKLNTERGTANTEFQAQIEALIAEREAVRAKLQGEAK